MRLLGSVQLALTLLVIGLVALGVATLVESRLGAELSQAVVYRTLWFGLYLLLVSVNLVAAVVNRLPIRRYQWSFVLTHFALVLLLVGAWTSRTWGFEGRLEVAEGASSDTVDLNRSEVVLVELNSAERVRHRYPVSQSMLPRDRLLQEATAGLPRVEMVDLVERGQVLVEPQDGAAPQTVVRTAHLGDANADPCVLLRVADGETEHEFWIPRGGAQRLTLAGRQLEFAFRKSVERLPFTVSLEELRQRARTGVRDSRDFEGRFVLSSPTGQRPPVAVSLAANEALDYMGYRLRPSAVVRDEKGADNGALIAVSYEPGLPISYVAFVLLVLGVAWFLFGARHRRRWIWPSQAATDMAEDLGVVVPRSGSTRSGGSSQEELTRDRQDDPPQVPVSGSR